MYFKNERHRQAFRDGMKKTNRKDKEKVSAVYLLSAEPCLWRRAKQASVYGKILLNNVRLSGITEILKENRNTLNDALIVSHALGEVRDEWMREEIERNALNGQYATKEELYADIRKMKIELKATVSCKKKHIVGG